jgi:hypothetical protein
MIVHIQPHVGPAAAPFRPVQEPPKQMNALCSFVLNLFRKTPSVHVIGPFNSTVSSVKQSIYSFLSPEEIAIVRTTSKLERAIIDHKYLRIAGLIDRLSTCIKESSDVETIAGLISLFGSLAEKKKMCDLALKKARFTQKKLLRNKFLALARIAFEQFKCDKENAMKTYTASQKIARGLSESQYKAAYLIYIVVELPQVVSRVALSDLALAEKTARLIKNPSKKNEAYKDLVCAYSKLDVATALALVIKIEESRSRAKALKMIAIEQSKNNREGAKGTLALAKAAANLVEHLFSKIDLLIEIAIEQSKIDREDALMTLLLAKGLADQNASLLKDIAVEQVKINVEAAFETLELIQDDYVKFLVLIEIAKKQIEQPGQNAAGTLERLIEIVKTFQNLPYQMFLFGQIATLQAKIDPRGAKETVTLVDDLETKVKMLREIALEEARNNKEDAKKTLEDALIINRQIQVQCQSMKVSSFIKIAAEQAKLDLETARLTLVEAKDAACLVQKVETKIEYLVEIACLQSKMDVEAAKLTLTIIKELVVPGNLATYLIMILKEEVKFDRAGARLTFRLLKEAVRSIDDPSQALVLIAKLQGIVY